MRLLSGYSDQTAPEGAWVAWLRYKYGALVPDWCVARRPMVGAVVRRPINSPTTRLSSHDLELQLHSRDRLREHPHRFDRS